MGRANGGESTITKGKYLIFVIIPLFIYYLYTIKGNVNEGYLDKNYYAFTILILGCIIFINKELREHNKIKKEKVFLPVFISTLALAAISLVYILLNNETNIIVILSDIFLIVIGGLAYYLFKTMQP